MTESILDLTLLFDQKTLFHEWLWGTTEVSSRTVRNVTAWNDFQNSQFLQQFTYGPAQEFPYKYMSRLTQKGKIGYWRKRLGFEMREYRLAFANGDMYDKNFPYRSLSRTARPLVRRAEALGVEIPESEDGAVTREELRRQVKDLLIAAQSRKDNEAGKGGLRTFFNDSVDVREIPRSPEQPPDMRDFDGEKIRLPVLMCCYGKVAKVVFEDVAHRLGFVEVKYRRPYPSKQRR